MNSVIPRTRRGRLVRNQYHRRRFALSRSIETGFWFAWSMNFRDTDLLQVPFFVSKRSHLLESILRAQRVGCRPFMHTIVQSFNWRRLTFFLERIVWRKELMMDVCSQRINVSSQLLDSFNLLSFCAERVCAHYFHKKSLNRIFI